MNVVRWKPWRERSALDNAFNRFFGDTFLPTNWLDDDLGLGSWKPVVDIYDNDENIVIKAELPGVDKKDIEVDLNIY